MKLVGTLTYRKLLRYPESAEVAVHADEIDANLKACSPSREIGCRSPESFKARRRKPSFSEEEDCVSESMRFREACSHHFVTGTRCNVPRVPHALQAS